MAPKFVIITTRQPGIVIRKFGLQRVLRHFRKALNHIAGLVIWRIYPSYFKSQVRWQYSASPWASPLTGPAQALFKSAPADLSSLTPVTYLSKLLGIRCVAAFLQLELFWVYKFFVHYCLLNDIGIATFFRQWR